MDLETHLVRCHVGRCENCHEKMDLGCRKLKHIEKSSMDGTRIVLIEKERGFLHFCKNIDLQQIYPPWYIDGWETVFVGSNCSILDESDNICEIYKVGPYLAIFKRIDHGTQFHCIPIVRTSLEYSLVDELSNSVIQFEDNEISVRQGLTQRLERTTDVISKHILQLIPEINEITRLNLSRLITQRRSVLGPILPILLDDLVEELYLDYPGANVYFDHQRLGRCDTTFTFCESDIPRIITLIRAESNLHLDRSNPSLKMDLQILGASLRFSISIPPLSPDGLHLEIRRARNRPFTISDLIHNGTLTPEAAAILIIAVACRFNITITGGPGSGKTTLLNALDMTTPRWWRKIYIEDAVESRNQEKHHQARFRVDPIDEKLNRSDKSSEIIKCLHRSPDYLILGEIQTAEHSNALFQAIAAGLRTIQTCHSDSSSSLVSRWKLSHGIKDSNLAMMDLIVTLDRPRPGESKRRVKEIVETRRKRNEGLVQFSGLNTIYDTRNGLGDWTQDGSFLLYAKESGIESHVPALNSLIDLVKNENDETALDVLSEQLWLTGHPMSFVGNRFRDT
ncbi:MAG: ATPase, T2SS/T4P/T4SS family [Candidatus Thorarchaeota archaeon]